ncbi:MAG: SufS family cysteine desulfurase [Acidimicrobiia bacterium]|nr:SufS family cysteine desulfurase [Acidimicrobiia bacterium]
MVDLTALRADFPIFTRSRHALHFLDSGASSQKPAVVLAAMEDLAAAHYANVHRGAYTLSIESTEMFEATRRAVARFIGAADPSEIVITRGTTTSLNQVAFGWGSNNLRPGDRIVLTMMEHHANIVPWQMVAKRTGAELSHVPMTADYKLDLDAYADLMDDRVRVVAVTGMSNVLGTMPPIPDIAEVAARFGAITVVDAAQLVPHAPVDVTTLGADFLAFSGHKMLGPTGIGALWGKMERLEEMEPFEGGGEMIADVGLHESTWAPIPHRFEAGTPPIIEAAGLLAAIEYLEGIGMDAVLDHDRDLTRYALERLGAYDDVAVFGPEDLSIRGGVISFSLRDAHPHDVATILDEQGVAVRAGHHCAKPLLRELGVPATARASFHVYNTRDDVDALIAGLERVRSLFSR